MPLPVPNLDDRRFQELFDDAKRMIMTRCPEWTDHNVSDPGVTLFETFAHMTDLDLIGLRMLPPTPAQVPVTFWLSAPASTELTISVGTRAGTIRTDAANATIFATRENLTIVPCSLQRIRTAAPPEETGDQP